jgi:hypothetical protein
MRRRLHSLTRAVAFAAIAILCLCGRARAIDFYEIEIYTTETTPKDGFEIELHSNSVTTATGTEAHNQLNPYQIHETLEATYGLTPHIEVGQYLATARLGNGNYEYAGSRTKCHFGLALTDSWPFQIGANVELGYMRRAAEENPLTLELRPIIQRRFGKLWIVANLAFEKPFRGPGTHKGMTFAPSGEIIYDLFAWVSPALEYYGDMGAVEHFPSVQDQQHFVVPALNFHFIPQLELNLGIGFGVTRASNGAFLKSIVGWGF